MFSFYEGVLFRIVVKYDRHEIEGLTVDDMVKAISRTYGVAVQKHDPDEGTPWPYGDEEEILARWQDANHHFDLSVHRTVDASACSEFSSGWRNRRKLQS